MASVIQAIKWGEQAREAAVEWARANAVDQPADERRIQDYSAGHAAGWGDCIQTLKLHGLLKLTRTVD